MDAFKKEFPFLVDKCEIMDLLGHAQMDYTEIECLKLPSGENNIVWHPGVYVFIGDNQVYRVGVSVRNSRARVMKHLDAGTNKNGYNIWDINKHPDKAILLINVKQQSEWYWLLAVEGYLEQQFTPLISAGRRG